MGEQATQPERGQPDDGIVRRSFDIAVRGVDKEARTVEVVASTTTVDSYGDVIEQDWDLARYLKNPVVLWNHNVFAAWRYADGTSDPKDFLPIGHSVKTAVEGGQLVATLKFGSAEYNEMSERVFLGFAEGHIRAVSVGFYPGVITEEAVEGGYRYRLSQCELLEISAVPIPANPDAVAKSAAAEHKYLGRLMAERRAVKGEGPPAQETSTMAMTPEEQKSYEKALSDARTATERADKSEALLAQLREDNKAANERAKKAEGELSKSKLDALEGVKFGKGERAKLDELVTKVGIDEVLGLLETRAPMAVTDPVTVKGKELRAKEQPAPGSTDDSQNRGASASIVDEALAAE